MVSDPAMLSKPRAESSGQQRQTSMSRSEVADDIRVFGPVQTMEDHRAGLITGRAASISLRASLSLARRAAAVSRPARATARSLRHISPQLRVIADVARSGAFERQIRGFGSIVAQVTQWSAARLGRGRGGRPRRVEIGRLPRRWPGVERRRDVRRRLSGETAIAQPT
jgi:hypothetical protein